VTPRAAVTIALVVGPLLGCKGEPTPSPAPVQTPSPEASAARNGLDGDDQARFYHLGEGSEVYPLSWLRALNDSTTKRPFTEGLERYGLIPDERGPHNPEGLPIGITADKARDLRFAGVTMVGVNCAACHVSELRKDGRSVIRMDGAPNLFDLSRFYGDLAKSTVATFTDVGELWAFLGRLRQPQGRDEAGPAGPTAALSRAYPRFEAMREASGADKAFAEELEALHKQELARPAESLGKGVVLAGRQEAVALPPGAVRSEAFDQPARKVLAAPPNENAAIERLAPADQRKEAVKRSLADFVNTMRLLKARAEFIVHLAAGKDLASTAPGYGRVDAFGGARNLLFPEQARPLTAPIGYPHLWDIGRTSWFHWDGSTNSLLERNVGQALGLGAVFDRGTFVSTVNIGNIQELERIAGKIKPPTWPAAAFGAPHADRATRGRELFRARCATCHADPPAGQPLGDRLFALEGIGTDRRRALNFALPVGTTEFNAAIAPVLKKIISAAGGTPRPEDVWRVTRQYAGRPLVAVWATAPYLHNGSVPSIDDLLRPAADRPRSFPVCGRDYDPVKLGLANSGSDPSCIFDTTLPGNDNGGHTGPEYGTDLSAAERADLIDFLKGP
jgi:mono/diheme cytochrome c family protein